MVSHHQKEENPEILAKNTILVDFGPDTEISIFCTFFRVLHMAMKFMQVGFRSENLQYTTGAGPSA